MSKVQLPTPTHVNLRWILQRDLPAMLCIEQPPPSPQWTTEEFREIFQSADTAGWVAEFGGQVVGFLVYRVTSQPDLIESLPADQSEMRWYRRPRSTSRRPLGITLLNLAVAPSWQRRGIGRALLERIGQKLQRPQDHIQISVPESNLAMQLLLRSAGYRAISVQRGYFGPEDGYLMEKRLVQE